MDTSSDHGPSRFPPQGRRRDKLYVVTCIWVDMVVLVDAVRIPLVSRSLPTFRALDRRYARAMTDAASLPYLRALARRFPTADAALAEIGHLEAVLTLPKGTVHVVSDVHGEHKKLTHIVNNASGRLRPLVESL